MKKIIAILLSLLTLVLLVSCNVNFTPSTGGSENGGNTGGNPIVEFTPETVTAQIASLLKEEYTKTKITVTTDSGDITLKNEFEISKSQAGATVVSYVVRKANKITLDEDNNPVIPSSQYQETIGTVEIDESENVTLKEGEAVDIDFSNISNVNFNLAVSNFTDLSVSDVKLTANVKSAATLLNADGLVAKDCTISAYYAWGEAVKNVKINYVLSNGDTVKIVYVFTK